MLCSRGVSLCGQQGVARPALQRTDSAARSSCTSCCCYARPADSARLRRRTISLSLCPPAAGHWRQTLALVPPPLPPVPLPTCCRWLAPEVLSGHPGQLPADVWAFGTVLWEMCTWRLPFENLNTFQVGGSEGGRESPRAPGTL